MQHTSRPDAPAHTTGSAPPPAQRMTELVVGSWAARAAVALGIPELLAGPDPVDSARLAAHTGAGPSALRRLMDYLVALEICAGDAEGYRRRPARRHARLRARLRPAGRAGSQRRLQPGPLNRTRPLGQTAPRQTAEPAECRTERTDR
ncbi:methyltransferase family protein [Streptomyces sp. QTS52]